MKTEDRWDMIFAPVSYVQKVDCLNCVATMKLHKFAGKSLTILPDRDFHSFFPVNIQIRKDFFFETMPVCDMFNGTLQFLQQIEKEEICE